jgi:hypothetical protein
VDNRNVGKIRVILLGLLSCGLLMAAGAAVVNAPRWWPMSALNRPPPNGTPGSAQPGTIGLARPHPPIQVP